MCHLEYGLFGVCICLLLSDSETPWTAARQAPLLWDSPGKNAGVGCHDLFQVIFPTQESNLSLLCLLHWQVGSLPLRPLRNPWIVLSCGQLRPADSRKAFCLSFNCSNIHVQAQTYIHLLCLSMQPLKKKN